MHTPMHPCTMAYTPDTCTGTQSCTHAIVKHTHHRRYTRITTIYTNCSCAPMHTPHHIHPKTTYTHTCISTHTHTRTQHPNCLACKPRLSPTLWPPETQTTSLNLGVVCSSRLGSRGPKGTRNPTELPAITFLVGSEGERKALKKHWPPCPPALLPSPALSRIKGDDECESAQ